MKKPALIAAVVLGVLVACSSGRGTGADSGLGTGSQSYQPCASSTDCPSGESCFSDFPSGLCTKACATNANCLGTDVCVAAGTGHACTKGCTMTASCRSDLSCENGACVAGHSQSADCETYVACFISTGGTPSALEGTYGPNGTCWTGTQVTAQSCTDTCVSALAAVRAAYPDAGC